MTTENDGVGARASWRSVLRWSGGQGRDDPATRDGGADMKADRGGALVHLIIVLVRLLLPL
jgi:hypothetical protein